MAPSHPALSSVRRLTPTPPVSLPPLIELLRSWRYLIPPLKSSYRPLSAEFTGASLGLQAFFVGRGQRERKETMAGPARLVARVLRGC